MIRSGYTDLTSQTAAFGNKCACSSKWTPLLNIEIIKWFSFTSDTLGLLNKSSKYKSGHDTVSTPGPNNEISPRCCLLLRIGHTQNLRFLLFLFRNIRTSSSSLGADFISFTVGFLKTNILACIYVTQQVWIWKIQNFLSCFSNRLRVWWPSLCDLYYWSLTWWLWFG